jgi:hypothetical protein
MHAAGVLDDDPHALLSDLPPVRRVGRSPCPSVAPRSGAKEGFVNHPPARRAP